MKNHLPKEIVNSKIWSLFEAVYHSMRWMKSIPQSADHLLESWRQGSVKLNHKLVILLSFLSHESLRHQQNRHYGSWTVSAAF